MKIVLVKPFWAKVEILSDSMVSCDIVKIIVTGRRADCGRKEIFIRHLDFASETLCYEYCDILRDIIMIYRSPARACTVAFNKLCRLKGVEPKNV